MQSRRPSLVAGPGRTRIEKLPFCPIRGDRVLVDDFSLPVERPARLIHAPIITVQQHILREQRRFAGASGEFSWLLSGITLATKLIEAKVRRAGLSDILGVASDTNIQGEVQQKLDVYANEMLLHALSVRESVAMMASEENEHPMLAHGGSPSAKYIVVFDPLDGSSNIDVNVSVGTTFSILRRTAERLDSPVAADESCNAAAGKSRRAMWCTALRPCWSTAPATACTALRSIRRWARTC